LYIFDIFTSPNIKKFNSVFLVNSAIKNINIHLALTVRCAQITGVGIAPCCLCCSSALQKIRNWPSRGQKEKSSDYSKFLLRNWTLEGATSVDMKSLFFSPAQMAVERDATGQRALGPVRLTAFERGSANESKLYCVLMDFSIRARN